jgi:hypothetical protein
LAPYPAKPYRTTEQGNAHKQNQPAAHFTTAIAFLCLKKIHAGNPCRNQDAFVASLLVLDTTTIPKRQAMIRHGNRQQFLIRIGLGLAGLKLWQRLVKLAL